jgi:hypothetical protein
MLIIGKIRQSPPDSDSPHPAMAGFSIPSFLVEPPHVAGNGKSSWLGGETVIYTGPVIEPLAAGKVACFKTTVNSSRI